jgi:hypothetical protein
MYVDHKLGYVRNFQQSAQSKQSPKSLKFAISGHPADLGSGTSNLSLWNCQIWSSCTLLNGAILIVIKGGGSVVRNTKKLLKNSFARLEIFERFQIRDPCVGTLAAKLNWQNVVHRTLIAWSKGHVLFQGCQMVYFYTKIPNLGLIWRALEWKMMVYFRSIWNSFRLFLTCNAHVVQFVVILV